MVSGVVWCETSQRGEPSSEVALSRLGNGMESNPRVLARLESIKLPSDPESINTCCENGEPETEKDTVITGRAESLSN